MCVLFSSQGARGVVQTQQLVTGPINIPHPGTVAIGGSHLLVGAPYIGPADGVFTGSGAAFVYDETTGVKTRELDPSDPTSNGSFGSAVAISNQIAVIGADGENSITGAAYVFNLATGQQLLRMTPSDQPLNGAFGEAVAINGNRIIVGAPNNSNQASLSGAVYVYDATNGSQLSEITNPAPAIPRGEFGNSVALNGTTAVIGAAGGFTTSQGTAYLYNIATGTQTAQLTAPDLVNGSHFGQSVAISGSNVLIGTSNDFGGVGSAYLFNATTGSLLREFIPPDGTSDDGFGSFVALSGNTALIAAPTLLGSTSSQGSVYTYDISSGVELNKIVSPNPTIDRQFGWGVGVDGSTGVIDVAESPSTTYEVFNVPEPSCGGVLLGSFAFAALRRVKGCAR